MPISFHAAAADPAYVAGGIIGRLIIPLIGVLLLVAGLRRRSAAHRDPRTPSTAGRGLIVAGSIVLGLGLLAVVVATIPAR